MRKLGRMIPSCLLACTCACGGVGDAGVGAEAAPAGGVEGSPSVSEVERLALAYTSGQLPAGPRADFMASLSRLSPDEFKRFRVAVADINQLDGVAREMYDALTDVLHEHRVFVLDAGPELIEEAVRRALAKRPGEFGPDVIERAVQHAVLERTPPASQHLTR
jgi:hypothetical protein